MKYWTSGIFFILILSSFSILADAESDTSYIVRYWDVGLNNSFEWSTYGEPGLPFGVYNYTGIICRVNESECYDGYTLTPTIIIRKDTHLIVREDPNCKELHLSDCKTDGISGYVVNDPRYYFKLINETFLNGTYRFPSTNLSNTIWSEIPSSDVSLTHLDEHYVDFIGGNYLYHTRQLEPSDRGTTLSMSRKFSSGEKLEFYAGYASGYGNIMSRIWINNKVVDGGKDGWSQGYFAGFGYWNGKKESGNSLGQYSYTIQFLDSEIVIRIISPSGQEHTAKVLNPEYPTTFGIETRTGHDGTGHIDYYDFRIGKSNIIQSINTPNLDKAPEIPTSPKTQPDAGTVVQIPTPVKVKSDMAEQNTSLFFVIFYIVLFSSFVVYGAIRLRKYRLRRLERKLLAKRKWEELVRGKEEAEVLAESRLGELKKLEKERNEELRKLKLDLKKIAESRLEEMGELEKGKKSQIEKLEKEKELIKEKEQLVRNKQGKKFTEYALMMLDRSKGGYLLIPEIQKLLNEAKNYLKKGKYEESIKKMDEIKSLQKEIENIQIRIKSWKEKGYNIKELEDKLKELMGG